MSGISYSGIAGALAAPAAPAPQSAAIGGLTVNNPLQIANTANHPVSSAQPSTGLTYAQISGILGGGASAPQAAPLSAGAAPANTTPGGASGYNSAGYSSSTGTYRPDLVAALQGNYDNLNHQLQSHLDELSNIYGAQQGDLSNTYTAQNNSLQHQHALGQSNLDQSQVQQDASHANSLRDLANQFRGSVNGYSNQLGNYGAGNSSAVGMINYALGQQANRNRGDIQQQAGFNQTNLNQSRAGLETGYGDQLSQLEAWKQQQLNQLAGTFASMKSQYNDQLQSAAGNHAVQSALYNLPDAQAALGQLQALDAQYTNHKANLQNAYQPHSVDSSFSNAAQSYQAAPISQQQLNTLGLSNQTASYANPTQTINIKRPEQYSAPSF